MTKKKGILLGSLAVFALVLIYVLYRFNYLPHPKYSNEKFGIETYRSQVDRDGDGVDDQTDILQSVRAYLDTRPKYKSKYYATGYPDDGYGVCTDVVAFGLLGAGYDLMELLMRNPGRVYSRENLLNIVWGYEYAGEYRTVDVHIRRLREKLEAFDGASPKDLARELITQSPQGATDDRTALVIRVEKRRVFDN